MRVLVLGGTVFLGRHIIDALLARGHAVTAFTRGNQDDVLPGAVEQLTGNRHDEDLAVLENREWDAVIDTSGYTPAAVGRSVAAVAQSANIYAFVSSASVYGEFDPDGTDESHPVATMTDDEAWQAEGLGTEAPAGAGNYGEWYGPLKARCEQAAEAAMPDRVLNVRSGLLVGPYDASDRFTYWVRRVAAGGEVLVPEPADEEVRVIDVRDMAEWIVLMCEQRRGGTFNASGADGSTRAALMNTCREVSGSDARFAWVDGEALLEEDVEMWSEVPLWAPGIPILRCTNDKAVAAGLTFRPLADTVADTLAWDRTRGDLPLKAGLDADRERELIEKLRSG